MAYKAGLSPCEFDELSPNTIWNYIDAHYENEQAAWERARIVAFTAGMFGGNSNPKKFPRSPERFLPFAWDKNNKKSAQQIIEEHRAMKEKRLKLLNNQANG